MTADIQENLAAICKLLEARTVECPTCVMVRNSLVDCGDHIGSSPRGRIPDPQYDALRAVVYGETVSGLRDWDSQPLGALAGALMVACGEAQVVFPLYRWSVADVDAVAALVVRRALEVTP